MWLRVDDGYDTNHKILALREVERWRWTRVLVYCAKHRNKGVVTLTVLRELGLEKTVDKLTFVGLLDRVSDQLFKVHDWYIYNGENLEERIRAFIDDHPEATANEVYRVIGGKRALVLSVYAELQESGSPEPPSTGSREPQKKPNKAESTGHTAAAPGSPEPHTGGSLSVPLARVPAPLPTPKSEKPLAEVRNESSTTKADAGLTALNYDEPASASSTTAGTTDPLGKLVLELRDRDAGTEHVFRRAFGGLPEAAFEYTREEILRLRHDIDSDCGAATRILERIAETGDIGDPDYAPKAPKVEAPSQISNCPHCGPIRGGPRTLAEHMHVSHGEAA